MLFHAILAFVLLNLSVAYQETESENAEFLKTCDVNRLNFCVQKIMNKHQRIYDAFVQLVKLRKKEGYSKFCRKSEQLRNCTTSTIFTKECILFAFALTNEAKAVPHKKLNKIANSYASYDEQCQDKVFANDSNWQCYMTARKEKKEEISQCIADISDSEVSDCGNLQSAVACAQAIYTEECRTEVGLAFCNTLSKEMKRQGQSCTLQCLPSKRTLGKEISHETNATSDQFISTPTSELLHRTESTSTPPLTKSVSKLQAEWVINIVVCFATIFAMNRK